MRFFSGMVSYGNGSGCSFGGNTLEEALDDGFKTASYYVALTGAPVKIDGIRSQCAHCYGAGIVHKGGRRVKCPVCKGKDYNVQIVGPFEVGFSRSVVAKLDCQ